MTSNQRPITANNKQKEEITMPKTDITVKLIGEDGTAFAVIAKVSSDLAGQATVNL